MFSGDRGSLKDFELPAIGASTFEAIDSWRSQMELKALGRNVN